MYARLKPVMIHSQHYVPWSDLLSLTRAHSFLSYLQYRSSPILPTMPNYAGGFPSHCSTAMPEPSLECTPPPSGMPRPSKIMWSSCDDHATMCYWCHLIGRPLSQWTWDLGVNPLIFHSIFIYGMLILFDCSAVLVCVPVLTQLRG